MGQKGLKTTQENIGKAKVSLKERLEVMKTKVGNEIEKEVIAQNAKDKSEIL